MIQQHWKVWQTRFQALSRRERSLLALLLLTAVAWLGGVGIVEPIYLKRLQQQQAFDTTEQQLIQHQELLASAQWQYKQDPDLELNRQISALKAREALLQQQLELQVRQLVSPAEMAALLEETLALAQNIEIISLRSLPAQALTQDSDSEQQEAIQGGGYYLHPFSLTLSGRYRDIYTYLKALEAMPVAFYWQQFDYQVKRHPIAEVNLMLYTLGPRKEFIRG
ncbi:hypothetical protein [Thaumasiovibrio sp. DFM-14]|uniref:hypothetical protein n=1 Tax=Thaumasiovibrio sp. DFM-14 TaxID=3384792 RepID=UPI0039A25845